MVVIRLHKQVTDTKISRDDTEKSEEKLETKKADKSNKEPDSTEHEYTDKTVIVEIRSVNWNLTSKVLISFSAHDTFLFKIVLGNSKY